MYIFSGGYNSNSKSVESIFSKRKYTYWLIFKLVNTMFVNIFKFIYTNLYHLFSFI